MNKRTIIIAVFVISIIGLAIVQYQYLRIGLNLARVQFSENVAQAGLDIKNGLYSRNQLTNLLGDALLKDNSHFNASLENLEGASTYFLKDYIEEKLINNSIDADFSFELMARDSTYYLSSAPAIKNEDIISYPLEIEGYLPRLLGSRMILQLQFKNLNAYYLSQLDGLVLPGLLFLAGILIAVIWVLRTYYWQRNIITTTNAFINNLTHELRTPVFSISLAAKILGQKSSAENQKFTKMILEQTERLSGQIDKVLELGNLETSKGVLKKSDIDFYPALIRCCQEFQALYNLENGTFEFQLEDGPYRLFGSEFHLVNAVNNLLDNARKYGLGNPIALSATPQQKVLKIVVTDQGKGIEDKEMEKVFKKYYRGDQGDTHEVKGYGLGLSYVKSIVDAHRGKIKLEKNSKGGTTVILNIPLKNGE